MISLLHLVILFRDPVNFRTSPYAISVHFNCYRTGSIAILEQVTSYRISLRILVNVNVMLLLDDLNSVIGYRMSCNLTVLELISFTYCLAYLVSDIVETRST